MVDPNSKKTDSPIMTTQAEASSSGNGHSSELRNKQKKVNPPLAYYEELMRHDSHVKVHRRTQQRGWGR